MTHLRHFCIPLLSIFLLLLILPACQQSTGKGERAYIRLLEQEGVATQLSELYLDTLEARMLDDKPRQRFYLHDAEKQRFLGVELSEGFITTLSRTERQKTAQLSIGSEAVPFNGTTPPAVAGEAFVAFLPSEQRISSTEWVNEAGVLNLPVQSVYSLQTYRLEVQVEGEFKANRERIFNVTIEFDGQRLVSRQLILPEGEFRQRKEFRLEPGLIEPGPHIIRLAVTPQDPPREQHQVFKGGISGAFMGLPQNTLLLSLPDGMTPPGDETRFSLRFQDQTEAAKPFFRQIASMLADFGRTMMLEDSPLVPVKCRADQYTMSTIRSGLLYSGSECSMQVTVPRNGVVRGSVASPFYPPVDANRLEISVRAGEEPDSTVHVVPMNSLEANLWHEWQADLSRFGGSDVTLTFRHEGSPEHFSALALGEPILTSTGETDNVDRPNIILISLDTLRADAVAPYDDGTTAPALKAFADKSLVFSTVYSQSCWTTNSHQSMLTGLWPHLHNIISGDKQSTRVPQTVTTLAEIFAKRGYETAAFTGGAAAGANRGFHHGFERYEDAVSMTESLKTADGTITISRIGFERAETWLEERKSDAPFCLFLHTYATHDPYQQPPEYNDLFLPDDPALAGMIRTKDMNRNEVDQILKDYDAGTMPTAEEILYLKTKYQRGVRHLDDYLATLFSDLESRGLLENSIIIITSDHGEEFFEHDSLKHVKLYDTTLHVPLYIHVPASLGFQPAVIDTPVRGVDLVPTILELAGIDLSDHPFLHGRSLLGLVRGENAYDEEWLSMISFVREHGVRTPGEKLFRQETGFLEWYDLQGDPGEHENRALERGEYAALRPVMERFLLGMADSLPGWNVYLPAGAEIELPVTISIAGVTASERNASITRLLYDDPYPAGEIVIGQPMATINSLPALINVDGQEGEEIIITMLDSEGNRKTFSCKSPSGDEFTDIKEAVIHPDIRERFFSHANLQRIKNEAMLPIIAYNNYLNAVLRGSESEDPNKTIENELRNLGYLQ